MATQQHPSTEAPASNGASPEGNNYENPNPPVTDRRNLLSTFPQSNDEHQHAMSENALPLRPLSSILQDLHLPVNETSVQQRENRGGQMSDFVSWWDIWQMLERITNGHFNWSITSVNFVTPPESPPFISMTAELTLIGADGYITRGASAQNDLKAPYGDPTRNCEASVLRRCALKFGLTRQVHRRPARSKNQRPAQGQGQAQAQRGNQQPNQRPQNPNQGQGAAPAETLTRDSRIPTRDRRNASKTLTRDRARGIPTRGRRSASKNPNQGQGQRNPNQGQAQRQQEP